ncbi:MAG: insulinase family protein [Eubacteriales bacterium]
MRIEELNAYEVIEKREIADLHSVSYLVKHKKTGAKIAMLENEEENKVFYIGFRTPPAESTGVPHILEHTVLCGSKDFPVKDPFIELAKGSLNTFLNAMTYPDKTLYPIASCNEKDFQNLMHVYLDAVFYPNIYKNDMMFKQEGWHYEMEDEEDTLTINGVVYNEMKGAFSSPDDVLNREIMNSLFPDNAYGVESGGDPDEIPNLTYEHFLEVHSQYYHPSNSYIYLYGNMDMVEKLQFIDEFYLSKFEALEIDSHVVDQAPFAKPVEVIKQYSITDNEPEEDNAYLSYNIVAGKGLDREHYIAFQILDYVLCSAPGAVLKQALLDAGVGKDIYSYYENGIKQPYFSIVSKNVSVEKKEDFVAIIENMLSQLATDGLDKKALEAALNYYEFKYREGDFGAYPSGLLYGIQMLDSWLYDEKQPFIHIEANATFGSLREKIQTDYYEKLMTEYLLGTNHKSVVVVEPVRNLNVEKELQLKEKLQAYKASLSKEEIKKIVEDTAALEAFQEEEEDPEVALCIPVLGREDLKTEVDDFVIEEHKVGNTVSLYHNIFTNGIGYIRLLFDVKQVPEELFGYLGIFKAVLGYVDTKHYGYADLFNEINIQTGGIVPVINAYTNSKDLQDCKVTFEMKAKVLEDKLPQAFSLLKEIMLYSDMDNSKRLYEIISELKSRMEATAVSAGHQLAVGRATSYFSRTAAISEQISGVPCLQLVKKIEANFEQEGPILIEKLQSLVGYIFREENLILDYIGSEESYQEFEGLARDLKRELIVTPLETKPFIIPVTKKNEGFLSASQVQYVCRAGDFIKKGLSYTGALRVLKVIMGYEYLWQNVRVKGGAYGCMSGFSKSGESYFVSYRDPNLKKTIDVYEKAAEFVANFQGDERSVTQYIIGAISELDAPLTPSTKGMRALSAYMTNIELEDLQRERDQVLATDVDVIRGLASYIKAFISDDCLCVVGNEEKIKEEQELFDSLQNLI